MTLRLEIKTDRHDLARRLKTNSVLCLCQQPDISPRLYATTVRVDKTGHRGVKSGGTGRAGSSGVYLFNESCANATGQVHHKARRDSFSAASHTVYMDVCIHQPATDLSI